MATELLEKIISSPYWCGKFQLTLSTQVPIAIAQMWGLKSEKSDMTLVRWECEPISIGARRDDADLTREGNDVTRENTEFN